MRCYEEELEYERINIKDLECSHDITMLNFTDINSYVLIYNNTLQTYSDYYYMLNDPVSVLDTPELKRELIIGFASTEKDLEMLLYFIHNWLVRYSIDMSVRKQCEIICDRLSTKQRTEKE